MAMTGKDIIKALECCAGEGSCAECPYDVGCVNGNHRLAEDALKLIKRQQAEIERLHEVINGFEEQAHKELMDYMQLSEKYQNAKSEAIKEFAERLKSSFGDSWLIGSSVKTRIDNIVKELTEDNTND